ncbi:hypothetical protein A3Q56_02850 [Intoshia linei]|uniref:Arp2/3 complex 41 kDa subunit n=1 Tax=Intoshia linei TaxID=1819745 RepID=A0A177B544_9BILA|nr:hypothetical protein A3Q56_02850 [Intoshia linei]
MTQVFDFKEADVMTCHAWNKDCSQLAMSPRSNELFIYKYDGRGTLTFSEKLIAHTQRINSVDWCPVKNRIITAGADRNVYVWNLISNKWTKTLVIMRSNRAAVSVQWSYNGEKFACGCASRLLAIAYYDEKNNWWTSKLIKKKIRSTVTCVSWSPDLAVIACGTSGFKARIFGTIIKDYDKFVPTSKWSDNLNVGNPIQDYTCGKLIKFDVNEDI